MKQHWSTKVLPQMLLGPATTISLVPVCSCLLWVGRLRLRTGDGGECSGMGLSSHETHLEEATKKVRWNSKESLSDVRRVRLVLHSRLRHVNTGSCIYVQGT